MVVVMVVVVVVVVRVTEGEVRPDQREGRGEGEDQEWVGERSGRKGVRKEGGAASLTIQGESDAF